MPRGFGLSAVRRANFKMPVGLTAAHFTTSPITMAAGTLYAADAIGAAGGFSTFTVAATPAGPFAASVDLTVSQTVYVKAASPYSLVLPAAITIS